MPLPYPLTDNSPIEKGVLYVVAMPIGHDDDITLRALKILAAVDVIAAEDTRLTARKLSRYQITARLVSCHEYNEMGRASGLVQKLQAGAAVALVSDAGTPSVSDPGYRLIQAAIKANLKVVPIPGVSAAITALSVSGLPTDAFTFLGFPPRRQTHRIALLQRFIDESRTLIFYESPRRVLQLIGDAIAVLGSRPAVLSREMTKPYEEFIRGTLSEIRDILSVRPEIKGECTLLISGQKHENDVELSASAACAVTDAVDGSERSTGDLARDIALQYGISRKKAYQMILSRKSDKNPSSF
jgi:16S rRNA (cytidine1402-2'-O)-methyltransferase